MSRGSHRLGSRRRWTAGWLSVLLVAAATVGLTAADQAAGATSLQGVITGVDITPVTPDIGATLELDATFAVPSGTTAQPGDYFSLALPKQMTGPWHNFSVLDPATHEDVADVTLTFDATTGREVATFTFTSYVSTHQNVGGIAKIYSGFDPAQAPAGQPTPFVSTTNDGRDFTTIITPKSGGGYVINFNDAQKNGGTTSGDFGRTDPHDAMFWTVDTPQGPFDKSTVVDAPPTDGQGNPIWTIDCATLTFVQGTGDQQGITFLDNPQPLSVDPSAITCTPTQLVVNYPAAPAGIIYQLTFKASLPQATGQSTLYTWTNTATVTTTRSGVDQIDHPTGAISQNLLPTGVAQGDHVSIVKYDARQGAANGVYPNAPGEQVDPTTATPIALSIQNTGSTALTGITVTDATASGPALDNLSCDFSPFGGPSSGTQWAGSLPSGQIFTCTGTIPAMGTSATGVQETDTATVSATGNGAISAQSTFNQNTAAFLPAPAITVLKSTNVASVSAVGDKITYTFHVVNTGNVALSNVVVTDTQAAPAGALDAPGVKCPGAVLAAGASMDCTATYTATQVDIDNGSVQDSATAAGTPPSGAPVGTPPSVVTVPVVTSTGITVSKTPDVSSVAKVGDTITYKFHVTNTSNVTLSSVSVTDAQTAPAGALNAPGVKCPGTVLAPGASMDCTGTYTVTQADLDAGAVDDVAVAHGTPPSGVVIDSPPANAHVPATASPAITVVKRSGVASVSAVGDKITYTFHVVNTGNVALSNVVVTDTQAAPAGALDAPGVKCPGAVLAAGASMDCTATYTATQVDIDNGSVQDSATAAGTPPSGAPVGTPPSVVTVPVVTSTGITVSKTPDVSSVAKVGDTITYKFHVTNTSNVTLSSVSVTDAQTAPAGALNAPGVKCPGTVLAPGASMDCTGTYTVTQADLDAGAVDDVAVAHGTPPSGVVIDSPPANAHVPATASPAITVVKRSGVASVSAVGDKITYTFHVVNTGNVALSNVVVTDTQAAPAGALDAPGVKCPGAVLAAGASMDCTATYTATQVDIDNGSVQDSATAAGTPPSGAPVGTPPSVVTVPVVTSTGITVSKTPDVSSVAKVGDTITYKFHVTNTSNVTLSSVSVTDAQTAPAGALNAPGVKCPGTVLAPGASMDCTGTYTVTQADLDAGAVDDIAWSPTARRRTAPRSSPTLRRPACSQGKRDDHGGEDR